MKQKRGAHNKYTNKPNYSESVVIRLSPGQRKDITDIAKKYDTTFSAVVRLGINKLIEEVIENEEQSID